MEQNQRSASPSNLNVQAQPKFTVCLKSSVTHEVLTTRVNVDFSTVTAFLAVMDQATYVTVQNASVSQE